MHWTNARTTAGRRPRSGAAARQVHEEAAPQLIRDDVGRPAGPGPEADQGVERGLPGATVADAATSPNAQSLDEPDPAPRPDLLRLRHADRA